MVKPKCQQKNLRITNLSPEAQSFRLNMKQKHAFLYTFSLNIYLKALVVLLGEEIQYFTVSLFSIINTLL